MAVVLPGKFVYLATPHTGSMAVAAALKNINGAFSAYHKPRGIGHHATLKEVKRVCGDQLTGAEVVFTTIRNPYDVLATWYVRNEYHFQMRRLEEQLERELTIRDFLELWLKLNTRPHLVNGRIFYHALECQKVIRYENLQGELNALMRKIPGTPGSVPLERENPTPSKKHWSLYFDDPTYAWINEHFQADFVDFGYPFIWGNTPYE